MIIIKPKQTITSKMSYKNENELKNDLYELIDLYPNSYILSDEMFDNHQYAFIHLPNQKENYELYYYNDYDDYEDDLVIGSRRWFKDISQNKISDQIIDDFLDL